MYKFLMIAVLFFVGLMSVSVAQASETQLGHKPATITDDNQVAHRGWRGGGMYWGNRGFYGGYYQPYGYNSYQPYYYNYPSGYYNNAYSSYGYGYPYSSYYYNTTPGISVWYGW